MVESGKTTFLWFQSKCIALYLLLLLSSSSGTIEIHFVLNQTTVDAGLDYVILLDPSLDHSTLNPNLSHPTLNASLDRAVNGVPSYGPFLFFTGCPSRRRGAVLVGKLSHSVEIQVH